MEIFSKSATREKLLTYLSMQAKSIGKRTVCIPYEWQRLADCLGVEGSGLSAEIGKLRREGVLQSVKNTFTPAETYPKEETYFFEIGKATVRYL